MASGRPLRPNDPSVMSSVEAALTRTRRPGPLEFTWHWRWELGGTALVAGSLTLIVISFRAVGLIAAAGAGLAVISTLLCCPPARRPALARARCVITAHRLRKGCTNAWVQTRDGRLPWLMSCTPAGHGERARIWLPAGLTADDLTAVREILAAACWAADVHVHRDPQRAHLVTIEVIRTLPTERPVPAVPPSWPYSRQADGDPADPEDTYLPSR
jgi:hypothetical protein